MAGIPPPADSSRGLPWMSGTVPPPSNSSIPAPSPPTPGQMQFRPSASGQLGQQFLNMSSQQFRPGIGPPPGMAAQYSQMSQRPNQPVNFNQQQRPTAGPPQPASNVGVAPPPSFQYASSAPFSQPSYGVTPASFHTSAPPQLVQSMHGHAQAWPGMSNQPNASGPPSIPPTGQPNNAASNIGTGGAASVAQSPPPNASDWQEHSAPDGRRYYYNKKTKVSSWEKPVELMTLTERADASTVWKEFTTADGRKYYYNKLNKQSKWTMPEEMKLAREKLENAASPSLAQGAEVVHAAVVASATSPSPMVTASSPASLAPSQVVPRSPLPKPDVEASAPLKMASPAVTTPTAAVTDASTVNASAEVDINLEKEEVPEEPLSQDTEKKIITERINVSAGDDNSIPADDDQPIYSNKTEAKNVFKELLEAKNVGADWSWEQAMRVIVNDKRYGALKMLGERKQTFNEYVAQKKKQEVEEKRLKQKKAREEFSVMLQESKELTSTMRWSKAAALFAEDPRFIAVDRDRERAELFEDYLHDLEKKEREQAREDRKKYLAEYKKFLETCDFIKASTQWRKVVDKLEDDERYSRLEKIDRLEIFQEHIKELEKQEEEDKREQKEQQRRRERKNRDEFRKLLADHKESGVLTARTFWKDYVQRMKDDPVYEALCTNLTGSTPKDLFEDFMEDLEKMYQEDKMKLKEAIKDAKVTVTSSWTFDMFKDGLADAGDLATIDESNLKIVFEDLLDRAREKEEKEAKKRKRLVDEFNELLYAEKSITASSNWEDCKMLLENAPEFRALSDDSMRQELFEEYVGMLLQKAKEKERKREEEKAKKEKEREKEKEKEREREKRKEKERKEKEREKEREKEKEKEKEKERERVLRKEKEAHDGSEKEKERSSRKDRDIFADMNEKEREKSVKEREVYVDTVEMASTHIQKDDRRKEKEKDRGRERERERKHRKSHRSRSSDDGSSGKEDKEEVKRSRKHSSDRRKSSRKHAYESNSDSENRHKRHKKDRDAHRRNGGGADELEDGELGEDGEIE